MAESCAFDEAVKGASGFIHMATPVMETADPNIAIPVVVNGTLNAVQSAAKEPNSSISCSHPRPVPAQMQSPARSLRSTRTHGRKRPKLPHGHIRRMKHLTAFYDVHYASKTQGEKEAWKWVRENKPNFIFNTSYPMRISVLSSTSTIRSTPAH